MMQDHFLDRCKDNQGFNGVDGELEVFGSMEIVFLGNGEGQESWKRFAGYGYGFYYGLWGAAGVGFSNGIYDFFGNFLWINGPALCSLNADGTELVTYFGTLAVM